MTNERAKKTWRVPARPAADDEVGENDRPTVNPPFDVEAFARAATAAEEIRNPSVDSAAHDRLPRTAPSEPAGRSLLSIANEHAPSQPNFPALAPSRNIASASLEGAGVGGSSSPEIVGRTIDNGANEMGERFSLGDYTGALEVAELLLAEDPGNLEAAECGEECRSVLEKMYTARLGPLNRIAMLNVPHAQMRWLSMDHRAGFVLSLIDGSSTVEMILDVCGMPRLDALRILQELAQKKIVAFR